MGPRNQIDVGYYFSSSSLHTREQAQLLFKQIAKRITPLEKEFYLDFSEIGFISRSFADELVYLTLQSSYKDVVQFCCLEPAVKEMISAVQKTQISRALHHKIPIHQFSGVDDLLEYFSE